MKILVSPGISEKTQRRNFSGTILNKKVENFTQRGHQKENHKMNCNQYAGNRKKFYAWEVHVSKEIATDATV